jgi:hypothetical protein
MIDEFGHVDNGMFAEDYIEQLEKRLAEAEALLQKSMLYLCYDGSLAAGVTQEEIEAFLSGKEKSPG